jgi:hypothetical protein
MLELPLGDALAALVANTASHYAGPFHNISKNGAGTSKESKC